MSISSSEHLSNEIVFEIFDYLDGIDIYEAFSNLNCRLEQFLNLSSLLFKIKLQYSTANQIFMKNYQKILLHNKSQIFFMNVWLSALNDQFFTFYPINLSFNHLESLIVQYLEKRWYEYRQYDIVNSSIQLSKSTNLEVKCIIPDQETAILISNIKLVLTIADIYHLELLDREIFISTLIAIIYSLAKLVSLKLHFIFTITKFI
ncbi:unnamed protein product [Rotaria sp. Silwood1]|nr:unnamed protein product [Rotaria sp. Silwood1]